VLLLLIQADGAASHMTRIKSRPKHSPLAEHIGLQLIKQRDKLRLTKSAAAQKCKLSRDFFCNLENGKTLPGADTLLKLTQAFGVPVWYWFAGFSENLLNPPELVAVSE
jgi:transcriptional regulator with XRE-family HTH domain